MKTRVGFILIILVIFISTSVSGDIPEQNASFIHLERGMCYGYCPVYTLTLFENGSVIYDGERFVKETGIRNETINITSYSGLLDLAEETGFFGMNDEYSAVDITDMPSATITITNGNRYKRVDHYHGDRSAPENLSMFEEAIDLVGNVTQWTSPFEPGTGDGRMI